MLLIRNVLQSIKRHFKYNFLFYFILAIAFIMGAIIGPLLIKRVGYEAQKAILKLSHSYFKNIYLGEYDGASVLKTSFINNLLIIFLIGVLGLVNLGIIIIPIIIFIKGALVGFSVAFLVQGFGVRGFLAALLGVYPQNIFIIIGLIGVGALGMTLSYSLGNLKRSRNTMGGNYNINEYIILILAFTIIIIIGGFIEWILSPIVMRLVLNPSM